MSHEINFVRGKITCFKKRKRREETWNILNPCFKCIINYNILNICNMHESYKAINQEWPPNASTWLLLIPRWHSKYLRGPFTSYLLPPHHHPELTNILNYMFLILNINVQDHNLLLKILKTRYFRFDFFFPERLYRSYLLFYEHSQKSLKKIL